MKPRDYTRGNPPNLERMAWRERFGLKPYADGSSKNRWTDAFLNQLCHCKSDEARRIIVRAMVRRERDASGNYSRIVCGKEPVQMKRNERGRFAGTPGPGRPAKKKVDIARMMALAERLRA